MRVRGTEEWKASLRKKKSGGAKLPPNRQEGRGELAKVDGAQKQGAVRMRC